MLDKGSIFRPLLSQKFTILNTFCKCWQEGASLGLAENMDRVSPLILPPTSFFRFAFFSSGLQGSPNAAFTLWERQTGALHELHHGKGAQTVARPW